MGCVVLIEMLLLCKATLSVLYAFILVFFFFSDMPSSSGEGISVRLYDSSGKQALFDLKVSLLAFYL